MVSVPTVSMASGSRAKSPMGMKLRPARWESLAKRPCGAVRVRAVPEWETWPRVLEVSVEGEVGDVIAGSFSSCASSLLPMRATR
jgi:hypothetical protein